jgi:hypothetical protein
MLERVKQSSPVLLMPWDLSTRVSGNIVDQFRNFSFLIKGTFLLVAKLPRTACDGDCHPGMHACGGNDEGHIRSFERRLQRFVTVFHRGHLPF